MIGYVETAPTIEPHNGGFLATFMSGNELIQLMLTPHAVFYLEQKIRKAKAEATYAALGKDPIPLKPKQRRR